TRRPNREAIGQRARRDLPRSPFSVQAATGQGGCSVQPCGEWRPTRSCQPEKWTVLEVYRAVVADIRLPTGEGGLRHLEDGHHTGGVLGPELCRDRPHLDERNRGVVLALGKPGLDRGGPVLVDLVPVVHDLRVASDRQVSLA